ncbi:MAG: hypothetical protein N2485_08260, partial [bacterium]|nr:hypothetical protein [bacterium]
MEDNSFLIAFYVGSSKEYSIPKFEEDIEKIFLENFKINDNYLKARELLNTRLYLIKENGGKFSRLITQEIILRNKILDIDKCINYINSDSFITNCEMLMKNIFHMERIFIHSKSR